MNPNLEELLKTDKEFSELSSKVGASKAFEQYLTEDAIQLLNRNNPIIGRNNITESMIGDYTMAWSPQNGSVSSSGDMGYTWGNYEMSFTNKNGEKEVERGKYLNIWFRQPDGTWKVGVDMGNLS